MSTEGKEVEQVLPESLQKLELVPVCQIPQAAEQVRNPFLRKTVRNSQNDEQVAYCFVSKSLAFVKYTKIIYKEMNNKPTVISIHTDNEIDIRTKV